MSSDKAEIQALVARLQDPQYRQAFVNGLLLGMDACAALLSEAVNRKPVRAIPAVGAAPKLEVLEEAIAALRADLGKDSRGHSRRATVKVPPQKRFTHRDLTEQRLFDFADSLRWWELAHVKVIATDLWLILTGPSFRGQVEYFGIKPFNALGNISMARLRRLVAHADFSAWRDQFLTRPQSELLEALVVV